MPFPSSTPDPNVPLIENPKESAGAATTDHVTVTSNGWSYWRRNTILSLRARPAGLPGLGLW